MQRSKAYPGNKDEWLNPDFDDQGLPFAYPLVTSIDLEKVLMKIWGTCTGFKEDRQGLFFSLWVWVVCVYWISNVARWNVLSICLPFK
jgi:hypothetical protein